LIFLVASDFSSSFNSISHQPPENNLADRVDTSKPIKGKGLFALKDKNLIFLWNKKMNRKYIASMKKRVKIPKALKGIFTKTMA